MAWNELSCIVDEISAGQNDFLVEKRIVQGKQQVFFWVGGLRHRGDNIIVGLLRRLREDRGPSGRFLPGLSDRTRQALHLIGQHLLLLRGGKHKPKECSRLSTLQETAFAATEELDDDTSMPHLLWEPIELGWVRLFYEFKGELVGPLGEFRTGSSWEDLATKHVNEKKRNKLSDPAVSGDEEIPDSTGNLTKSSADTSCESRVGSPATTPVTSSNMTQPSGFAPTLSNPCADQNPVADLISWTADEGGNPVFESIPEWTWHSTIPAPSKG